MKKPVVFVTPNNHPDIPNTIEGFIHCAGCAKARPPAMSPQEWAHLEIGFQPDGTVQIWCYRCEKNVAVLHMVAQNVQ